MKKIQLHLIGIILIQVCVNSAFPQNKSAEKLLKGLDLYIENSMKDWEVPGLAVAVVKDSSLYFAKGYGYRDVEKKLPVTEETLFAIGSCTKAFTAVSVGLLGDRGKVELEKPVITYIPTFKMYDDYVTNHITPLDLMCHRSGLPRHDFVWYGKNLSRSELMNTLQYLQPSRGFRSAYQYQNLMFMAAGVLVEEVAGMKWETFISENIFTPLQMKKSNFSVNDMQKSDNFSFPYSKRDDKIVSIPFRNIDAIGPAGNINSSVLEMSNWMIIHLNKGRFNGKEIISGSFLKETHSPQMVASKTMTDEVFFGSYGLGWFLTSYRGYFRSEHGGGIDGFISSVCLYPNDNLGIVVLTNYDNAQITSVIRNYITDRMLGLEEIDWHERIFKPVREASEKGEEEKVGDVSRLKDTKPSFPLEDYTGKYRSPAYGTVTISLSGDTLLAIMEPFLLKLNHYHLDVFEGEDPDFGKHKLKFHYNIQGEVNMLTINLQAGVPEIEFVREPDIREMEKADLEKYAGEYDFGGASLKIYVVGETILKAFIAGQPEYELTPLQEHVFALKGLDGYRIIFNLNEKGEVFELISEQPNGSFKAVKK
ncbi:MAG: serine hydrolase [Bacteroidales bacterium]|nr:MAG: serine hydrolase [Bacteroidales bacterium]